MGDALGQPAIPMRGNSTGLGMGDGAGQAWAKSVLQTKLRQLGSFTRSGFSSDDHQQDVQRSLRLSAPLHRSPAAQTLELN